MKRTGQFLLGVLIVSAWATAAVPNKELMTLFQDALYQEQTAGDLDKAIELYQKVAANAGEIERLAAKATFQLGMCWLKKGDTDKAVEYFQKVVSDYPAQKELAANANKQLKQLGITDASQEVSVVSTVPAAFSDDVDPSLDKITATFNTVMMDGSWSWTGGGETYPQITGKPYYDETKITCTLPVKLEPGKVYWVGINSPSHKNFKTPDRISAKRYVILFATRNIDGKPTDIPEDLRVSAARINAASLAHAALRRNVSAEELANIVEEAVATVSTCAETDPRVNDAIDSLAGLDTGQVVAEVCKHLESDKNTIRRAAIYILWKGGLPDISAAQGKLIELCGHEENFTRGMAALALSNIRTADSLEALKKMTLEDADGFARRCAVYALGLYGDAAAIPVVEKALEDQDQLVKDNAQAAMALLTKQAPQSAPALTQEMFNDIQPDATIKFRNPQQIVNTGTEPITETRFINSDFVQLTAMTDQQGNPIKFTSQHEGSIYRYHVTFDKPVLPGETFVYISEGTITGLITPVAGQVNTFRYSMTHSPATGQPTLRIESYLLPAGAEVISTTPADMQRSIKDGRIELKVEKVIPAGGSLTTSFKYKLAQ